MYFSHYPYFKIQLVGKVRKSFKFQAHSSWSLAKADLAKHCLCIWRRYIFLEEILFTFINSSKIEGNRTSRMGIKKPPDLSSIKLKLVDSYGFRRELNLEEAVLLNQVEENVRKQVREWWNHEASIGAGWYLKPEIANSFGSELQEETKSLVASLGLSVKVKRVNLLKRLIRSGIPPQMRPKVWKAISGMSKKKSAAPDSYYHDLLLEVNDRETKSTKQIDNVRKPYKNNFKKLNNEHNFQSRPFLLSIWQFWPKFGLLTIHYLQDNDFNPTLCLVRTISVQQDLHRTFPSHPKMDTQEGRQALRRILVAYSWRDSRVGYCQVSRKINYLVFFYQTLNL